MMIEIFKLNNLNVVRNSVSLNIQIFKSQGLKLLGPQGFWGSGEKGYLFSGSWGALLIILGEQGSKHILMGIKGALPKSKKNKYQASILSDSLKCRWLLGAVAHRPPYINVISFQFNCISFQKKYMKLSF